MGVSDWSRASWDLDAVKALQAQVKEQKRTNDLLEKQTRLLSRLVELSERVSPGP